EGGIDYRDDADHELVAAAKEAYIQKSRNRTTDRCCLALQLLNTRVNRTGVVSVEHSVVVIIGVHTLTEAVCVGISPVPTVHILSRRRAECRETPTHDTRILRWFVILAIQAEVIIIIGIARVASIRGTVRIELVGI